MIQKFALLDRVKSYEELPALYTHCEFVFFIA
jgi:hypothetical protein